MLTQVMFDNAATEITAMITLAIAGGITIFGAVKGVKVGLQIFSGLVSGR